MKCVLTNNEQLFDESVNAYPPYEYTENLLEMYIINDDNIAEIVY